MSATVALDYTAADVGGDNFDSPSSYIRTAVFCNKINGNYNKESEVNSNAVFGSDILHFPIPGKIFTDIAEKTNDNSVPVIIGSVDIDDRDVSVANNTDITS